MSKAETVLNHALAGGGLVFAFIGRFSPAEWAQFGAWASGTGAAVFYGVQSFVLVKEKVFPSVRRRLAAHAERRAACRCKCCIKKKNTKPKTRKR